MGSRWLQSVQILLLGSVITVSAWGAGWNSPHPDKALASALRPNHYSGYELFRTCASCHSRQGWGRRSGSFPQISGQHFNVLVKQLIDMRENRRENPSMQHFIAPEFFGDAQALTDVAAYISGLPMAPENGVGAGDDLMMGKAIYADSCSGCHGATGEGDNERYFPRIQGQHYQYLIRQFNWIKEGERLNAHPKMAERIGPFSRRDTEAVLDYVSRLTPPEGVVAPSREWKNPDFN